MAKNEPKIYKHSNIKSIISKIIVIVIAAAIILALTAFFGFRKFIAYTETGKLYLDIPWLYGYMPGPPEEDDLAEYLKPTKPQPNVAVKVDDSVVESVDTTEETTSETTDTETSSQSNVPQYVDPTPPPEETENEDE